MRSSQIDLPTLVGVQPFNHAGTFKDLKSKSGKWDVRFPGLNCIATYDPDFARLRMQRPSGPDLEVEINAVQVGKGLRHYFICGCCCDRRLHLVLRDEELLCESTYVDLFAGKQKTLRRAALLLAKDEFAGSVSLQPVGRPGKARLKRESTRPPKGKTHMPAGDPRGVETETAIARGHGLAFHDIFKYFQSFPPEYWANQLGLPDWSEPQQPDLLDYYPKLDLRVLRAHLQWAPGGVMAHSLDWGRDASILDTAVIVDWREEAPNVVVAFDWHDIDQTDWFRLPIHKQPGGHLRFVCPVRGVRADVLYYRNGIFASREAQRLVHLSQRAIGKRAKKASSA